METILSAHPTIFLAVHGPRARDECLTLLEALSYTAEPLVGDGVEPNTEVVARSKVICARSSRRGHIVRIPTQSGHLFRSNPATCSDEFGQPREGGVVVAPV
jgi:hypothetical protein